MDRLQADEAILQVIAEATHDDVMNEKAVLGVHGLDDKARHSTDVTTLDEDEPTEDEKSALRRVPGRINWSVYLIATVEMAERFSYYGATAVFTNFIQQPLPGGSRTGASGQDGQSGALGMGQQASTGLTTYNSFWVYCTPLIGAYIADAHLGRYTTIMISIVISFVGHVLLTISAIPSVITNQHGSLACFIVAIIIMGAGTGGFKPNISPLVAEQIEMKQRGLHTKTLKNGEKVIIDPNLTISRIYMYFYLAINIGALVGQIGMVYSEKYVGFWLAYLLPTALFLFCPLVMIFGKRLYALRPPQGSVFAQAMHLWTYAMKGRWTLNPIALAKNMTSVDFWESVKPSRIPENQRPGWMHFDDAWVDEVRRGFKACTVFCWYPVYWLCYNQTSNNLTSQAAVLNTHGLPNDVLSNLDPFTLIILIPICDLFLYPALRKAGVDFSPLKKICAGFITGALAMMSAAIVQHYIYKQSVCGYKASTCDTVPNINVWVQTPSYLLIAISEVFASITGLEYAFTLAPKFMRSLVMAAYMFTTALSNVVGEAFNTLSADPLLVLNYGVFGVMSFIAGILFYTVHRSLDKDHNRLLEMKEGLLADTLFVPINEAVHSRVEKGLIPGIKE